jgi:hypothetical protein
MRLRSLAAPVAALTLLLSASPARAGDPPSGAVALLAGAATVFTGFVVGGALIGPANNDAGKSAAGWLAIEAGLTLAPFTAHAAVGEWGRGALFAVFPALSTGASVFVFTGDPYAVGQGDDQETYTMMPLMVVGLLASTIGVVDAVLVGGRNSVRVVPRLGSHEAGLVIGGSL